MGRLDVPEVLIILGLLGLFGLGIHNWLYHHGVHLHK